MGAMEKKRLLPALILTAVAVSWAAASSAQDSASLEGIRKKSEKAELARAKNFLGNLLEPDMAEAEKTLSGIKNNYPGKKQTEEVMEILSTRYPGTVDLSQENPGSGKEGPALFYFFSFSVPRPSLREAVQESAAAGAVMVLRGLWEKDLGETASRISRLIGKSGTEAWIDPLLFECFSVGSVPQLVLARGRPTEGNCEDARYVKVSGDVSLSYALGLMEKEDANAGMFIKRLEQSGFYSD